MARSLFYKRVQALIALSGLFAFLLIGSPAAARAESYESGSLVQLKVASPEKDYPIRNVWVWTPPLGNLDRNTLPVVYMLHGWPGSPQSVIAAVAKPLVAAFAAGAKPFIAVFPDGNSKTHFDSEWADSSDKKAMIETWLTTNLITAVEGTHIRPKSARAIMGFSMGGYGAAIIGLHHPDLYSQIIPISGYYVIDDLTGAFVGKEKLAYQSPINYLGVARNFRWFLAEGANDPTALIHGQATAWWSKLNKIGVKATLNLPPGGHSFALVTSLMAPMAKWLTWPATADQPLPPVTPTTPVVPASPTPLPSDTATIAVDTSLPHA